MITEQLENLALTTEGNVSAKRSHLLRMAVNGHTSSSRHLAVRWSTTTGVIMSIRQRLLHRGLHARVT